jgi:hypothetical protein
MQRRRFHSRNRSSVQLRATVAPRRDGFRPVFGAKCSRPVRVEFITAIPRIWCRRHVYAPSCGSRPAHGLGMIPGVN